jgi:hypothetical protein
MLKPALAILVTTTIPAMAAGKILSIREVRFEHESFICGEIKASSGRVVRFIRSTPPAKYIPEYEPSARDPLAKSWAITYRIICGGNAQGQKLTAHLKRKRS